MILVVSKLLPLKTCLELNLNLNLFLEIYIFVCLFLILNFNVISRLFIVDFK